MIPNFRSKTELIETKIVISHLSLTRGFRRSAERRRGVSTYIFVLALPMMLGVLGIVVDMGNLYSKRAQAQRAADAAAIAGAMEKTSSTVTGKAREYARLNGYQNGVNGARVKVINNVNSSTSEVRVVVSRAEPVYFAPILEGFLKASGQSAAAAQFSRTISAQGTATRRISLPLGLGGIYGIADPARSPVNNSVFGPDANYNFGDAYSPEFLQDGVSRNPLYDLNAGVGEYTLNISSQYLNKYSDLEVQIYDPDCYDGPNGYDEIREPNKKIQRAPKGGKETVTEYALYDPSGNLIAKKKYGNDKDADGKWITPDGFKFSPTQTGQYKITVTTLSGSSENGFQLRAGPSEGANKTDDEWNKLYGDNNGTTPDDVAVPISAEDHLQINFTQSGQVKFRLGYVPDSQSGKTITVSKFDVDVGSRSIVYTCDTLPGQTFAGVLPIPGDGIWSSDDIQVPSGYTGGNWYAEYTAGKGDSSTWTLSGQGDGNAQVRLTR